MPPWNRAANAYLPPAAVEKGSIVAPSAVDETAAVVGSYDGLAREHKRLLDERGLVAELTRH
jgi:hypothetical protein